LPGTEEDVFFFNVIAEEIEDYERSGRGVNISLGIKKERIESFIVEK